MKNTVILAAALLLATPLSARSQEMMTEEEEAWLDLIRADVRTEKASLVRQAMNLNGQQLTAFEPVYQEYESELRMIWDSHLELIEEYAANYGSMDDAKAEELAEWAMELEIQRVQLLRETFRELTNAIGAVNAAHFVQIENRIDMLVNMEITSQLPMLEITN